MQLATDLVIDRSDDFDQTAEHDHERPRQCPRCTSNIVKANRLEHERDAAEAGLKEAEQIIDDIVSDAADAFDGVVIFKLQREVIKPLKIMRSDITLLIDAFERITGQHPLDVVENGSGDILEL